MVMYFHDNRPYTTIISYQALDEAKNELKQKILVVFPGFLHTTRIHEGHRFENHKKPSSQKES